MEYRKILNGKEVRDSLKEALKKRISSYSDIPKLVIVSVSQDERSEAYVKQKILFGQSVGVEVSRIVFSPDITQEELVSKLKEYNQDPNIHGIIIQLPLPAHIFPEIVEYISPEKDVDGLHPNNLGKLVRREKGFVPATVRGVQELLSAYNVAIAGKKVVIVGRSSLVGTPLALSFLHKDATVIIAHSRTEGLRSITNQADILCVAIGKPNFINKEYVRDGQIVVDIGINAMNDTLVGDVSFEDVYDKVSYITPVPGGVGPMTVYALFANLCDAYEKAYSERL